MKTKITDRFPAGLLLATQLIVAGGLVPLAASRAADSASSAPKTHTLFMGADVEVQVKKDFCRVHGASGTAFVVNAGGRDVSVSPDEGPVSLQVQQTLKLTEASATISDLKGARTYSPQNDPARKFAREQPGTAVMDDVAMADGNALVISSLSAAGGTVSAGGKSYPGGAGISARSVQVANFNQAQAGTALGSQSANMGNYVGRMQDELAKELFDKLEVAFEIASDQPLDNPYVLVIVRYHEKGATAEKSKSWVIAKSLDPVGPKPQKVKLAQAGFPLGFILDDFKVHLYDRGQELATTVADKRVPLTRDEAFQYLKLDYMVSHKGATLPPDAAMGRLAPELAARLAAGDGSTLWIQVSKDGLPTEVFVDKGCSRKLADAGGRTAILDLRFQPALNSGKPVDGVYRLNLTGTR
jgi:hypothetical protein